MPISGELREPFSVLSQLLGPLLLGGAEAECWCFLIGLKNVPPQYDGIVLDERKLFVFVS